MPAKNPWQAPRWQMREINGQQVKMLVGWRQQNYVKRDTGQVLSADENGNVKVVAYQHHTMYPESGGRAREVRLPKMGSKDEESVIYVSDGRDDPELSGRGYGPGNSGSPFDD